jgi:hypothetical protein
MLKNWPKMPFLASTNPTGPKKWRKAAFQAILALFSSLKVPEWQ